MLRGGSGESGLPVQDHWNVWSPVFASLCKRFDDISLARSIFLEICAFLSSRVLCKVLVWSLHPSNSSKKSVFFLCFLHQLHLSVSLKYIIFLFLTKTDSYQICLPNVLNVFFFFFWQFLRPWTGCEPVIWNSVFWKLTYLIKLAEKQLFFVLNIHWGYRTSGLILSCVVFCFQLLWTRNWFRHKWIRSFGKHTEWTHFYSLPLLWL